MKTTELIIKDEVNCRFTNLDVNTRRKLRDKLKFFLAYAYHTPAYKLGRWDGTVSLCDIGGRTYINLLEELIPIVQSAGYDIKVTDNRHQYEFNFEAVDKDSYSHIKWPEGHPKAGEPIEFREHQVEIINTFLENPQGVTVCPTAGGKTIITGVLSHKIEPYGRSIVIVPTRDLVTQTEEDYVNMGLDVGVYYGDRKEYNKTHTICTWQSLEVMNKLKDGTVEAFIEDVVCVMVDEVHKAKADVLRKLLSGPFKDTPLRWGLTGTMPEEEHERLGVAACIGNTLGKIRAGELQEKGYLANLHINIMQTQDVAPLFSNYQSELKWITSDKKRLDYVAELIEGTISATGNTLILVDRVACGQELQERIPGSSFISGKVKSEVRKDEYKSAQFEDGKIIIATYGVASTGININRIFNLVLIEPGKSFVRVIQSIGRGLRVAEDKDFVDVYDITSSCKYAKKHLTKRKKFYKEAEYPFKVHKVTY